MVDILDGELSPDAIIERGLNYQDPNLASSNYNIAGHYVDRMVGNKKVVGFSEDDIKEIQRLTMHGLIAEEYVGEYRTKNVWVTRGKDEGYSMTPPNPRKVPELMEKFVIGLNEHIGKCRRSVKCIPQTVRTLSYALYVFSRIHPFYDGNGRVARRICDFITKRSDIRQLIILRPKDRERSEQRDEFISVLRSVDRSKNLAHLELLVASKLLVSYQNPATSREQGINRELSILISNKQREIASQDSGGLFLDMDEVFETLSA